MAIQPINAGRAPIIWSSVDQAFNVINDNFAELDSRSAGVIQALVNGSYTVSLDQNGKLILPVGGDILDSNGISVLSTLPVASTTVLGGVKVDGTSIVINNGVISTAEGGGVGLTSRVSLIATTPIISDGATFSIDLSGFKGYLLYKIEINNAAWVRIYTDSASRTADIERSELTDPLPGSGIIAEVITTGAESVLISPGTIGFNNEPVPNSNILMSITNKSGLSTSIIVTLTVVQLEA